MRRADKGFRLIKIGVDRQNRNLCTSQCICDLVCLQRCNSDRLAHICVYNGLYHVQLTVEVGIAVCAAYVNFYVSEILFRLLDACDNVAPVFGRGGLEHYAQLMGVAAAACLGIAGVIAGCAAAAACTHGNCHQSCQQHRCGTLKKVASLHLSFLLLDKLSIGIILPGNMTFFISTGAVSHLFPPLLYTIRGGDYASTFSH